jgi:hypothetical protein
MLKSGDPAVAAARSRAGLDLSRGPGAGRLAHKGEIELLSIHLMGAARMSDDMTRGGGVGFGQFHGAEGSLSPTPVCFQVRSA